MSSNVIVKFEYDDPHDDGAGARRAIYENYIATRPGVDLNAPADAEREIYLNYISERPGVDLSGIDDDFVSESVDHGLFDKNGVADLAAYKSEVRNSNSVIYQVIISFTENTAVEMNGLTKSKTINTFNKIMPDLCKQIGIKLDNVRWCAAIHQYKRPHIHLDIWEAKRTKTTYVIPPQKLKQFKAEVIKAFMAEVRQDIYMQKMASRDYVLSHTKESMNEVRRYIKDPDSNLIYLNGVGKTPKVHIPVQQAQIQGITERLHDIARSLPGRGRLYYAYMPPEVKDKINSLVDYMARQPQVSGSMREINFNAKNLAAEFSTDDTKILKAGINAENDVKKRMANIILKSAADLKNSPDFEKLEKESKAAELDQQQAEQMNEKDRQQALERDKLRQQQLESEKERENARQEEAEQQRIAEAEAENDQLTEHNNETEEHTTDDQQSQEDEQSRDYDEQDPADADQRRDEEEQQQIAAADQQEQNTEQEQDVDDDQRQDNDADQRRDDLNEQNQEQANERPEETNRPAAETEQGKDNIADREIDQRQPRPAAEQAHDEKKMDRSADQANAKQEIGQVADRNQGGQQAGKVADQTQDKRQIGQTINTNQQQPQKITQAADQGQYKRQIDPAIVQQQQVGAEMKPLQANVQNSMQGNNLMVQGQNDLAGGMQASAGNAEAGANMGGAEQAAGAGANMGGAEQATKGAEQAAKGAEQAAKGAEQAGKAVSNVANVAKMANPVSAVASAAKKVFDSVIDAADRGAEESGRINQAAKITTGQMSRSQKKDAKRKAQAHSIEIHDDLIVEQ